jgi:hypothetical protein
MIRRATSVVLILALTTLGITVIAGPASANRPTSFFENNVHFVCDQPGVTTSDGTLMVSAEDSTEFGRDAGILWWVPPDTIENTGGTPTFVSSPFIEDQTVTRTGYHFDIDLRMIDPHTFDYVGNATASIDLIDSGIVEEATPKKSKFGNRQTFDNSVVKFFSVSGTVTLNVTGLPTTTFDVTNCTGPDGNPPERAGFDTTIDVRISDPSQFVLNKSGVLVLCNIGTDDFLLEVAASAEKDVTGGQLIFQNVDGVIGGSTDSTLTLTNEVFAGTVPMFDFNTGDPVGDAVVDVRFTQGEHAVIRSTQGSVRDRLIGYLLNPTGTITIPTTPTPTVVDFSACIFAFDGTEQQKEHRPKE